MIIQRKVVLILAAAMLLTLWGCSHGPSGQVSNASSNSVNALASFLGRWDITIKTPNGGLPSWIEVSEDQGQPKVLMVGVSDHATPLNMVKLDGNQLEFLSPKGEEGFGQDTLFKAAAANDALSGTATSPGISWTWTGVKAPSLAESEAPKWGKPIRLFNGRNFDGWHFKTPSQAKIWKVEDHEMVKNGRGSELISDSKFQNFKLHVEFNCGPMSNSGVYLRGRYEVQIETDSASEPPSHHTAGVYGFLAPNPEQPRKANVWQSFDITLVGRTVTVVQNGITVIDHQEIPGITGGALDSDEGAPGPIYLQGTEKGRVAFRNIVITPAM